MPLEVLKALSDPCRLRLVAILMRGEYTVQELTAMLRMGQSRISRHLKILTEAGVLSVKRQGTWSYYSAGGESLFFASIRAAVEKGVKELPDYQTDMAAVADLLEQRRRRSQQFFDMHARQLDYLARTLLPVPDYQQQFLSLVPKVGSIVEIGLGTGGLLPSLARKAETVIGVDHSSAMLDEARRRLDNDGIRGVELRLGEMGHLPLPDGSVDCAVLNMVLHHAADPQAVLFEIRRVLINGGRLTIADLERHERELAREQLADQWLGFEKSDLGGWLTVAGFETLVMEQVIPGEGQESVLLIQAQKKTKENSDGK